MVCGAYRAVARRSRGSKEGDGGRVTIDGDNDHESIQSMDSDDSLPDQGSGRSTAKDQLIETTSAIKRPSKKWENALGAETGGP